MSRNPLVILFRAFTAEKVRGYDVDAIMAINTLARYAPEAAAWWREKTPYLLKPGMKLHFHENACNIEIEDH